MHVGERIPRLRESLAAAGHPGALLVTGLVNIRYLTGFTGSAAMLFVVPGETVLATDGRYRTQADEQLSASGAEVRVEVAAGVRQSETCRAIVARAGAAALVLEAAHVSWAAQRSYAEKWFPSVELVPSVGLVEGLRQIKDEAELARLGRAAAIADSALASLRERLSEGLSEADFARALDFEMGALGASGPSFETIVASGPNAAKPHHRPDERRIRAGEPIVIDFGALFDGYCSDMTRTVWLGNIDDPQMREALELVSASQAAGVAAVRSGVACADVDRACRSIIEDAGWGEFFVHGTGHGVGLQIHEAPSVAATSPDTLSVGHVVTVEPGVYVPGVGGVRIEDTVVVTAEGCRPLTSTPKDRL
jgi:Xaa-Pro aminopeptidase